MSDQRHIALIGPMGAGKSSIGRHLAQLLSRPLIDLDRCIEEKAGAGIPWIFDKEGEAGFRRRERDALCVALQGGGAVIACGGGVVLDADNRRDLRHRAFVVHLDASIDELAQRLARDRNRPLLQTGDRRARMEQLARERAPLYAATADLVFSADGSGPCASARRIIERLPNDLVPATRTGGGECADEPAGEE
jgi:shikimate kinase